MLLTTTKLIGNGKNFGMIIAQFLLTLLLHNLLNMVLQEEEEKEFMRMMIQRVLRAVGLHMTKGRSN